MNGGEIIGRALQVDPVIVGIFRQHADVCVRVDESRQAGVVPKVEERHIPRRL